MGDSDWPKQKGELTHRVPRGLDRKRSMFRIGTHGGWARWSWPEITNGAGNVSRPDVFCLPPAETDSQTDRLWLSRSALVIHVGRLQSVIVKAVPVPVSKRLTLVKLDFGQEPGFTLHEAAEPRRAAGKNVEPDRDHAHELVAITVVTDGGEIWAVARSFDLAGPDSPQAAGIGGLADRDLD